MSMMQNELKKSGITIESVPSDKQPTSDSIKRLDNEISSKKVRENTIVSMKFGWCNFKFITISNEEPFYINASYLTDVPDDILHFIEEYIEHGNASVFLDEEGKTANIVIDLYRVYVIENTDTTHIYEIDIEPNTFIDNLLNSLMMFVEDMALFNTDSSDLVKEGIEEKENYYRSQIIRLTDKIKH